MNETYLYLEFINNIINEINKDVEKLYFNSGRSKWEVLDNLREKVLILKEYVKEIYLINQQQDQAIPYQNVISQQVQPAVSEQKTFTAEELSRYNGKNGNRAYVAINGTVYDVTDIAAWAAATHFSLSAGNDVTSQFNTCHIGSDILSRLPVTGRLV